MRQHLMRLSRRCLPGLLLLLSAAAAQAESFPDVVARIKPAIVGIATVQVTRTVPVQILGTGFVVGDGRVVATNFHVIPEHIDHAHNERVVVLIGHGREAEPRGTELIATDSDHDLALLKIAGAALPALKFAAGDTVREGDDIAFTGFPIGAVLGLHPVTHHGLVSAITPIAIPARNSQELSAAQIHALREPYDVLQLDATAYPGNSGSPVYLRDSGLVIGIINMVLVKGLKENVLKEPSAISYAIPVRYLQKMLADPSLETGGK